MAHGELAWLFLEPDTGPGWTTVREESYFLALEQGTLPVVGEGEDGDADVREDKVLGHEV